MGEASDAETDMVGMRTRIPAAPAQGGTNVISWLRSSC
jgi:hypothetical protein